MGMFVREDPNYDESVRQKGFNRYKQLMSIRFGQWWKVNLITLAGLAPLAGGIIYSIGVSSMLVLFPCCVVGGMIAGPFLSGMYDAVLRGLWDDPLPWKDAWTRSWKQKWITLFILSPEMKGCRWFRGYRSCTGYSIVKYS